MAKDKPKTHGLLPKEMRERHQKQIEGAKLEQIPANGPDANGATIDAQEAHMVHYVQEAVGFDPITGKATGSPSTQQMHPRAFAAAMANNGFAGYAIKVIHAPEFAKKEQGEAVEGTRIVDTNYAALQARYVAATGENPDESLMESQLDAACIVAERFAARLAGLKAQPKGIDLSAAPAHTAPSTATPDALYINTEGDDKSQVAQVAAHTAETTPPTADGHTGVGQDVGRGLVGGTPGSTGTETDQTQTAQAKAGEAVVAATTPTGEKPGTTDKADEPTAPGRGRRGATPTTAK